MYGIAYYTHFRSLDNTLWDIIISIEDYNGRAEEISLEGDEPCIIEWKETGKTDVVQSSTCTLRVSNESDRQMAQLMTHRHAAILVDRNQKWYWGGYLDDAVYEEPYSFTKDYVTELIFSDFGILNRLPFTLRGKQSVGDIVHDCLESIGYGSPGATVNLYTSLLDPKTQQPITLDMLYINADRFAPDGDSWDAKTTKREVLEEILRPLGLRIMQKNGQIFIYDIEWLRDHDFMHNYAVWKGTDAYLRGSETFGCHEVAFETGAEETLAETEIPPSNRPINNNLCALYHDEDAGEIGDGFYIDLPLEPTLHLYGHVFRTRSGLSSSDDIGYAWRVYCASRLNGQTDFPLVPNDIVTAISAANPNIALAEALFMVKTHYLPLCPETGDYQMRVNLDLLLSIKKNPFEPDSNWNCSPYSTDNNSITAIYKKAWRKNILQVYVPVKLELLDEQGNVLMHYRNASGNMPLSPGNGDWHQGAAPDGFGAMLLAYYNDGLEESALGDGWATNRQTMTVTSKHIPSLFKKRADGEYVPMPPMAGIVRLTVSNCVYAPMWPSNQIAGMANHIRWHLLRNATITLVKANRTDDGIDTGAVYEREKPNPADDTFSETVKAGTWRKGIAPSAKGLLFNAAGDVWEQFVKNGTPRTLEKHRLRCIEDQTVHVQPVLSGTAELDIQMVAKRDGSTPGVFLVTALRQDLHQDTEEVTMARIANVGGFVYEFAWSDPYCAEEPEPYVFAWSGPVCAKEPGPYQFEWSNGICVKQYIYTLEWEEMER